MAVCHAAVHCWAVPGSCLAGTARQASTARCSSRRCRCATRRGGFPVSCRDDVDHHVTVSTAPVPTGPATAQPSKSTRPLHETMGIGPGSGDPDADDRCRFRCFGPRSTPRSVVEHPVESHHSASSRGRSMDRRQLRCEHTETASKRCVFACPFPRYCQRLPLPSTPERIPSRSGLTHDTSTLLKAGRRLNRFATLT